MVLDEIVKKTKEDLKILQEKTPFDVLGRSLSHINFSTKNVVKSLEKTAKDPLKTIAEVKKINHDKTIIIKDFYPEEISQSYENAGANALSVVTEPNFYLGNIDYIATIKRYSKLPILRKDFIIDKYQILQSLVYGADFVLLIAKILEKKELKELLEFAYTLGLEALVEVHDKDDLKKAIFAGANIIGINHRSLYDFTLDDNLSFKLIPLIPNGKIIVSQGNLHSNEQLKELSKAGVDAFLVGEYFMKQDNLITAFRNLKGY